jgi:hypothetical protein
MPREESYGPPQEWGMQWLLQFAEQDFTQLPRKDQEHTVLDVQDFLRYSANWDLGGPVPSPEFARNVVRGKPALRFVDLIQVQQRWRDGLAQLFAPVMTEQKPLLVRWSLPLAQVQFELVRTIEPLAPRRFKRGEGSSLQRNLETLTEMWTGRGRTRGTIRDVSVAGWEATFWHIVRKCLTSYGPRLQHCAECKKLYFKHKRQAYCTTQCSQRARSRKWNILNPEKAAELRHQAYIRRKQKSLRPHIQVKRMRRP